MGSDQQRLCQMARSTVLAAGLATALALAAGPAQAAGGTPPEPFPTNMPLRVVSIDNRPVPADMEMTLTIDDTLRGFGSSGCNRWSAALYPLRNNRLAMGSVALTRKICPPPVMAAEKRFLNALHSRPAWKLEDGAVILRSRLGTYRLERSF